MILHIVLLLHKLYLYKPFVVYKHQKPCIFITMSKVLVYGNVEVFCDSLGKV